MQKIIDGLLFDTEKAELICSFKYGKWKYGVEDLPAEGKIFRMIKWLTNHYPLYLDLCFVFKTNKGIYFTIGVFDEYEESIDYIKKMHLTKQISFDALIGDLKERFLHINLKWSQLTEEQARKICEGRLSVNDYMKYFPIEEA